MVATAICCRWNRARGLVDDYCKIAVFGNFSTAFTGQVKAIAIYDILHRCESGRSGRHARKLVKRSGWAVGVGSMAVGKARRGRRSGERFGQEGSFCYRLLEQQS